MIVEAYAHEQQGEREREMIEARGSVPDAFGVQSEREKKKEELDERKKEQDDA